MEQCSASGVIDTGFEPPEASADVGVESEVTIQHFSLKRQVFRMASASQMDRISVEPLISMGFQGESIA